MSYLDRLLSLVYPQLCLACGTPLLRGEANCCAECRMGLPYLGYHLPDPARAESPLAARFWGKVAVRHAVAYLRFTPTGTVQQLLHRLKYEREPQIGEVLGEWFGTDLAQAGYATTFDVVVPVPLHPIKERLRGYNQAARFGEGVAAGLGLPQLENALRKLTQTDSQTHKSRLARWQNVDGGFVAAAPDGLAGQRVLLVDDVLTTGATLEACATVLLRAGAAEVSVATLAVAGE